MLEWSLQAHLHVSELDRPRPTRDADFSLLPARCQYNRNVRVFSLQDGRNALTPFLRFVDEPASSSLPSSAQRTRRRPTVDVGMPSAFVLEQLLDGDGETRNDHKTSTATSGSVLLRRLVKRQPFQCLVNVVACWKR